MATITNNNINISYTIDEFINYKEVNTMLPCNIKPFCNEMGGSLMFRDGMIKIAGDIINSFMTGKNPNDIIFKNNIIESLNKITQKNYIQILDNLKKLAYIKAEHFTTLASEIIMRAMTDSIAVKGIELPKGQQSLSDIYILIVIDFFPLLIKENDKEVKFSTILLDICRKYFDDFSNPLNLLDSNNAYRVDNYKGFTNFLGLLYEKNLLNQKIVSRCLSKIKELVFHSTWEQAESENAYDGYKKIITHCINKFETITITENERQFIKELLQHQQDVRTLNKAQNKLRRFTMMYHDELDKRLSKF